MKIRASILALFLACLVAPCAAQDLSQLAPADEYFGHAKMSVLGIANTIRDAGTQLSTVSDPRSVIDGSLFFASDAIRDWEHQYPVDPWIAKNLLNLARVYLCVHTDQGLDLARQTVTWLTNDYPNSTYAALAKTEIAQIAPADNAGSEGPQVSAWERFASLRAPLVPQH